MGRDVQRLFIRSAACTAIVAPAFGGCADSMPIGQVDHPAELRALYPHASAVFDFAEASAVTKGADGYIVRSAAGRTGRDAPGWQRLNRPVAATVWPDGVMHVDTGHGEVVVRRRGLQPSTPVRATVADGAVVV